MNLNIKSIDKDQKRKIILGYVQKIYDQEKRFVSKREIRKIFHVELYNYFTNISDMYQSLEIEVPLCYCPKDYAKKKIVEYVREKAKNGIHLGGREIERALGISLRTYFGKTRALYLAANVDYELRVKKIKQNRFYSKHKIDEQKQRIIKYIKMRNKNGYFAGINEIQHRLKLNFGKYFQSSKEAYDKAGIDYERVCPIILGKNKEKIVTKIVLHLLVEMGFTIKRTSIFDHKEFNRGPDIEVLDQEGNMVFVEIKAYHKRYWITLREIKQLQRYMKQRNVSKGIFITTAIKINSNPKHIQVVNGESLINFLCRYRLNKFVEKIKWVQQEKVNFLDSRQKKELIRKKIVCYILANPNISYFAEVERAMGIDKRTYFGRIPKEKILKKIKNNSSICNDLLCRDPQLALQDT